MIGQPLALLLKKCPLVRELHLYDVKGTAGVVADLSHINTPAVVRGFEGNPELARCLKVSGRDRGLSFDWLQLTYQLSGYDIIFIGYHNRAAIWFSSLREFRGSQACRGTICSRSMLESLLPLPQASRMLARRHSLPSFPILSTQLFQLLLKY